MRPSSPRARAWGWSAGRAGPGLMVVVVGTVSARLGVTVPGTAVVDQPAGPEASNRPPVSQVDQRPAARGGDARRGVGRPQPRSRWRWWRRRHSEVVVPGEESSGPGEPFTPRKWTNAEPLRRAATASGSARPAHRAGRAWRNRWTGAGAPRRPVPPPMTDDHFAAVIGTVWVPETARTARDLLRSSAAGGQA